MSPTQQPYQWPRQSRGGIKRTGLLLLQSQLVPIHLHPIPQRHPEIGLFLWWHTLPSLLNIRQCRVGDGVRLAGLLVFTCYEGSAGGDSWCHEGGGRARSSQDGGAQHPGAGGVESLDGFLMEKGGGNRTGYHWPGGGGPIDEVWVCRGGAVGVE